jgi:hypothetical protein
MVQEVQLASMPVMKTLTEQVLGGDLSQPHRQLGPSSESFFVKQ